MRTFKRSTVLAAAFVGLFVGSARAQEVVIAKVPFPFVVRGNEFPAGRYQLTDDSGILTIRGMDTGSGSFALTQPADGRDPVGDQPALVFNRYENGYVLSQVWESGTEGVTFPGQSTVLHRADGHPVASNTSTVVLATNLK
jgi:hypothetical protein